MQGLLEKNPSLLLDYVVEIDDIKLPQETILSTEITYSNTRVSVFAEMAITDIFDLNALIEWDKSLVKITYVDLEDNMFFKEFVVLGVREEHNPLGRKSFILTLQDKFSYVLGNSYISKGFSVNLSTAFNELIEILKIHEIPELSYNIAQVPNLPKNYTVVIPNNISALEFFTREFYRWGCTLYQDKTSINVKTLKDLELKNLENNGIFTNQASNDIYRNRIYDWDVIFNDRTEVSASTRSIYYDALNKKIVTNSVQNDKTDGIFPELTDSIGNKEITQSTTNFYERELMNRRKYMDSTHIEIYVSGFIKNDLNNIYEIDLKGNQGSRETQDLGDVLLSGLYVSKLVQDKLVQNKLFQKITLHRADKSDVLTLNSHRG